MRSFLRSALVLLLAVALAAPLLGESAKSLYKKGEQAERLGNYEEAFAFYQQAFEQKPKEVKYKVSAQRTRYLAAASYVRRGQLLREAGQLENALALFEKAAQIDPSSFIALQEIRRTRALIEAGKTAPEPPPPSPLEGIGGPVEMAPIPDQRITLQMTEDAKVIYETIGKLAGLNVLFDPDYTARRIRVALNKVTLAEALDIVALQSKTFWRPVTPNTIFVAADTTTKRRELEQTVIRTFYLSNLSVQTEIQEIVNVIRQVLNVTRVQLVSSQSAIVMRGTPDQMLMAEKIISDIDRAKPEVVIEVAVMQVRRDKLRNLGINPPTSASLALAPTIRTGTGDDDDDDTNNGTTTTTNQNQINLNRLSNLDARDFTLTIPPATANFLLTDSSTKVLQNPQIRALHGQKASLKIGDRVPIATGSFQPGIGGVGINPLVNTQFNYIDVGVNIDITPTVHANREITLKLMLDVSSVTARVNIGGIEQPIIGQRKIEHEIRLKEGEVNLLGGILEESDVKSLSGIPGLAQIPFLRYFFSSESINKVENEIVFALVPRLVRGIDISAYNTRAIDVGRGETTVNLRRASPPPQPEAVPSTAPAPAPTQPQTTTPQPQPEPQAPANQPATAPAAEPAKAPEISGPALLIEPAAITAAPGGTVAISINASGVENVYSVPIQVGYDPRLLELVNVSNGGFLSQDGQPVTLVHRADAESGTIQLTASRPPGAGGVSGNGTVFVLTFIAKGAGEGMLSVTRPGLRNPAMQPVQAQGGSATVTIR